MSVPPAARGLRQSVERGGGTMKISVEALGDAFGRGRLSPRARRAVEDALARAGLVVEPGLADPPRDGWVTLRLATAPGTAGAVPAAAGGGSASGSPDETPAMARGALVAGVLGVAVGLLSSLVHALLLGVLAWTAYSLVRARGADVRRALAPRLPGPLRAPQAVGFLAVAVPALAVAALLAGTGAADGDSRRTVPAPPAAPRVDEVAVDRRVEAALAAGDPLEAVRAASAGDPARLPALKSRIAQRLLAAARGAIVDGAFVRAAQLAKQAQGYDSSPAGLAVLREARRGLDRRRAAERRARRRQEQREREREAAEAAAAAEAAPAPAPAPTPAPAPESTFTPPTSSDEG